MQKSLFEEESSDAKTKESVEEVETSSGSGFHGSNSRFRQKTKLTCQLQQLTTLTATKANMQTNSNLIPLKRTS